MSNTTPKKVFFYCYPPTLRGDGQYNVAFHYYQHAVIVLAEGLKKLGIECYANINYWKLSADREDYLLHHDPDVTPDDCDMVVLEHTYFLCAEQSFPDKLFHSTRSYCTVYLDLSDEDPRKDIFHPDFRQFDYIFKAHYRQNAWYPANVHPYAFGLSNRILAAIDTPCDFHSRKQCLLVNFRDTKHAHTLRKFIRRQYLPKIQSVLPINDSVDTPVDPLSKQFDSTRYSMDATDIMHYAQSSSRHFPTYYKRLKETAATACFGGFFTTPFPRNQAVPLSKNLRRVITKLNLRSNRILQWDSWRLWEAMTAGSVAFHVDFDKYGFHLPVMPENWKHYVGIDLDNMQASVDRIAQEPEILAKISEAGRQWAIEYYNPTAIASRFLKTIT
jgi:hypothetical protein